MLRSREAETIAVTEDDTHLHSGWVTGKTLKKVQSHASGQFAQQEPLADPVPTAVCLHPVLAGGDRVSA